MAESDDDSQKTEEPTTKRLEDSRKKGQVAFSREVTSFVMLVVFTLILVWLAPSMMQESVRRFTIYIEQPHVFTLNGDGLIALLVQALKDLGSILMLPMIGIIFVILVSAFLQNGMLMTLTPLAPKLERISLLQGIKRIFSLKSVVEFLKGIVKIIIIGVVSFIAVYPELSNLHDIFTYNVIGIMAFIGSLATRVMIGVCAAMGIIAVIDYLYQRFEFSKNMRMSKQEIKEEFKQTEGNPEVKAKLREIRQERAKGRMMAAVPSADVVITNPTHYSVALKYDTDVAGAPVVIAKGQDEIALKIREIAKENDVPLVQNPPLARMLFASVDIDEEIPLEHYKAVAEVIKYVYKLKGKKAA